MNRNEPQSFFSRRVSVGWLFVLLAALAPICISALFHLATLMNRNFLMHTQDILIIALEIVLISVMILLAIWRPTRYPAATLILIGAASFLFLLPLTLDAVEMYVLYITIVAFLCFGVGAAILPSDARFIRRIEALAFLTILAAGVFALWAPTAGLLIAIIIAVNLGLYWLINRAPLWAIPALIVVVIYFFAIAGMLIIHSSISQTPAMHPSQPENPGIVLVLFNPGMVFWLIVLFIACTMLPRRETWSRLWRPWLTRQHDPSSKQRAFTLIELLIAIAILSILFGGLFSVWGYQLKAMRIQSVQRAAASILDCQMDALMNAPSLPPPSEEMHPLPIALDDLHVPPGFSGGYIIAESRTPGLTRIDVLLTFEGLEATQQHFRFTAERRPIREAHDE